MHETRTDDESIEATPVRKGRGFFSDVEVHGSGFRGGFGSGGRRTMIRTHDDNHRTRVRIAFAAQARNRPICTKALVSAALSDLHKPDRNESNDVTKKPDAVHDGKPSKAIIGYADRSNAPSTYDAYARTPKFRADMGNGNVGVIRVSGKVSVRRRGGAGRMMIGNTTTKTEKILAATSECTVVVKCEEHMKGEGRIVGEKAVRAAVKKANGSGRTGLLSSSGTSKVCVTCGSYVYVMKRVCPVCKRTAFGNRETTPTRRKCCKGHLNHHKRTECYLCDCRFHRVVAATCTVAAAKAPLPEAPATKESTERNRVKKIRKRRRKAVKALEKTNAAKGTPAGVVKSPAVVAKTPPAAAETPAAAAAAAAKSSTLAVKTPSAPVKPPLKAADMCAVAGKTPPAALKPEAVRSVQNPTTAQSSAAAKAVVTIQPMAEDLAPEQTLSTEESATRAVCAPDASPSPTVATTNGTSETAPLVHNDEGVRKETMASSETIKEGVEDREGALPKTGTVATIIGVTGAREIAMPAEVMIPAATAISSAGDDEAQEEVDALSSREDGTTHDEIEIVETATAVEAAAGAVSVAPLTPIAEDWDMEHMEATNVADVVYEHVPASPAPEETAGHVEAAGGMTSAHVRREMTDMEPGPEGTNDEREGRLDVARDPAQGGQGEAEVGVTHRDAERSRLDRVTAYYQAAAAVSTTDGAIALARQVIQEIIQAPAVANSMALGEPEHLRKHIPRSDAETVAAFAVIENVMSPAQAVENLWRAIEKLEGETAPKTAGSSQRAAMAHARDESSKAPVRVAAMAKSHEPIRRAVVGVARGWGYLAKIFGVMAIVVLIVIFTSDPAPVIIM